ncbi:hypothetical protein [Actinomadura sp. WMMA1423]|uniref:hypothetical protein n=1 Tax=Actinomadura sp. WMMA1423 TaxID=2591108 RepID=UPI0011465270|nr:hypothetical protein [Actinomadura sp. WMMA1423]
MSRGAAGRAESSAGSGLIGVSATGPRDAWAVGYRDAAESDPGKAVLLRRDGLRWREAPLPREVPDGEGPARQEILDVPQGELTGIWQISPSDVWAVGFLHCYGDNCERPVGMHWDGSA